MVKDMITKADVISDRKNVIKITTFDNMIYRGRSEGIEPMTDDETGEELDVYGVLLKLMDGSYIQLTNEEIKSVEKE